MSTEYRHVHKRYTVSHERVNPLVPLEAKIPLKSNSETTIAFVSACVWRNQLHNIFFFVFFSALNVIERKADANIAINFNVADYNVDSTYHKKTRNKTQ